MPPINPNQNIVADSNPYTGGIYQKVPFWKRKPVKILSIVVTLALIMIIVLLVAAKSQNPQSISANFLNNILAGNITKSYQLTSSDFHRSTSLATWTTDVKTIDAQCSGKITLVHSSLREKDRVEEYSAKALGGGLCHINIDLSDTTTWQINSIVSNL